MQESTGFTDKADAENLLKQRIGNAAAGRHVGPERATIADLCNLVLEDNRLRDLRDAQHVEWRYKANVAPLLGRLPGVALRPSAGAAVYGESPRRGRVERYHQSRTRDRATRITSSGPKRIRRWYIGSR